MKTLLVPFFDDDAARVALDDAYLIAERFGAHIEGLFVVRPPQVIDGEGMAMMASYVTQLEEEGERLAERAREAFESSLRARGVEPDVNGFSDPGKVTASWREFEGLEGQVLGDYGRLFDLVVIGRGFGYPWSDWDAMCEAALYSSAADRSSFPRPRSQRAWGNMRSSPGMGVPRLRAPSRSACRS